MNKTEITFYRGCHGMGICIEVKYDKDRVIFDFGAPFEPFSEVYDGTVKHRIINRVKDAILLHKACVIDGIYAKKDLQDLDIKPYEESDLNTAILICHLHLDHMSEIDKVHPNIPVYISEDGLKMNSLIDEMEDNTIYRNYSSFRYNESFTVGQIRITPYFSDHSCTGSASFLIQTPDNNIVYTGDIRFHGTNRDVAFKSIENIAQNHVDLLIIDSTASSPSEFEYDDKLLEEYRKPSKEILKGCVLEQDLYDEVYDNLKDFDGIGVINISPRDINMLKNMYDTAIKLNRIAVYEPYYANILYKISGYKPLVLEPETSKPYIDLLRNELEFITIDEIRKNPYKYIVQNDYRNILNLTDFDGINGKYFHYFGDPLVQGTKQYQIMLNFLDKLKWEYHSSCSLYSFSHSYPNHLAWVVDTIKPSSVVAVHSKHPENFNPVNSKQFFPEENITYILEKGELHV